ncbi:MAG: hypothetical protein WCG47_12075 [Dermatophilaceae bacterium]
MSGTNVPAGPRQRVRWKSAAKYTLAFAGVAMLLWAIWSPENRVQWVLTGVLALATWGVWLAIDRDDAQNRAMVDPYPPSSPGSTARVDPVRSHRDERRQRRDERQS